MPNLLKKDIFVTWNSQNSAKTDFRGRKIPPQRCEVNIKHGVLYAGPILPFFDQNFLTGLAGWVVGGQGRSKYGQEGASRYKPDAKLLSSEPSRGLKWVKDPSKSYPHILMTYSKHLDVWNVNTNVCQMNLFMRSRHENGHMNSNRKSFGLP